MNLGRLIRFGLVGVVNTGVYYVCYLLLRLEIPYLAAHITAFVVAMIASYFLNCYITFKIEPTWRTFLLFPLSNLANFVITTVGLGIAVEKIGMDQRLAPIPVTAIAIPITYVVAHYIMLGHLRSPFDEKRQVAVEHEQAGA